MYETHARVALEEGDLNEFKQCQTRLADLFADGVPGNRSEFFAYRLLYMLHQVRVAAAPSAATSGCARLGWWVLQEAPVCRHG